MSIKYLSVYPNDNEPKMYFDHNGRIEMKLLLSVYVVLNGSTTVDDIKNIQYNIASEVKEALVPLNKRYEAKETF